jgi:hypothetical protein
MDIGRAVHYMSEIVVVARVERVTTRRAPGLAQRAHDRAEWSGFPVLLIAVRGASGRERQRLMAIGGRDGAGDEVGGLLLTVAISSERRCNLCNDFLDWCGCHGCR